LEHLAVTEEPLGVWSLPLDCCKDYFMKSGYFWDNGKFLVIPLFRVVLVDNFDIRIV